MRSKKLPIIIGFFCLSAWPASASGNIVVVGIDKDGHPFQTEVSADQYLKKFTEAVANVHEQTLRALEKVEQPLTARQSWALRSVSVGLGIGFDFGLGPILSGSVTPRLRLVYSNSTDAPMP